MFDAHAHPGEEFTAEAFICTSAPSEYNGIRRCRYKAAGYLPGSAEELDTKMMEQAAMDGFHIGEIGLDRRFPSMEKQEEDLRTALRIAVQYRRVAVIHVVREYERILRIIDDIRPEKFMLHGWTGSYEEALLFIKRGGVISLSPRAERTRSFTRLLSLPFVTETDMPLGKEEEKVLLGWNEYLSSITGIDIASRTEMIMKELLNE